jgi:hypothetical protein
MPSMIPDYVELFPGETEKTVHELLSGCNFKGFALHSLNVARHKKKIWGEIDFILITPFGLMALEVKGGELYRENGRWFRRSSVTGHETPLKESPFSQASSAMFQVIEELKQRGLKVSSFGWGLVTPQCSKLPQSPEYSPESHADFEDCHNAQQFAKWLRGLEDYWKQRPGGREHTKLNDMEMLKLAKALRPDCDLAVPLGKRLEIIGEEMKRFTNEQFNRLDDIKENDRILCRGGAGTGKTFLAMEVMRRETALGKRCLYVARSQPLVDYLKQDRGGMDLLSFDELKSQTIPKQWDLLVVDEGQDLLGLQFLEVFEEAVKGGLDNGRWRWFMDDFHQAGFYDDVDPEAVGILNTKGVTLQRLNVNCRNTRQIVSFAQFATGADIGEAKLHGDGLKAEFLIVKEGREAKALLHRISQWIRDDVPAQEIVVLTCASEIDKELQVRLPKNVRMCTVLSFKGLEANCVAVIGMESKFDLETLGSYLYTGLTRARASIWLAVPAAMEVPWKEMTMLNLKNMMENRNE